MKFLFNLLLVISLLVFYIAIVLAIARICGINTRIEETEKFLKIPKERCFRCPLIKYREKQVHSCSACIAEWIRKKDALPKGK